MDTGNHVPRTAGEAAYLAYYGTPGNWLEEAQEKWEAVANAARNFSSPSLKFICAYRYCLSDAKWRVQGIVVKRGMSAIIWPVNGPLAFKTCDSHLPFAARVASQYVDSHQGLVVVTPAP